MAEGSKSSIDIAFEDIEKEFGESRVIRKELIANLRNVAADPEMKISPYDKSMMIQSKLMVMKTLDDLLKSNEEISVKRLKMELARKDNETNGVLGATIVNMLKNIRVTGEIAGEQENEVDRNAVMKELKDKQKDNAKLAISDGELEQCGSKPNSDVDAEQLKKQDKKEKEEEE